MVAATATGGRKLGLRHADSERQLADQLRRDRLVLMRTWRLPAALASERRLRLRDQSALNDQLAQLLSRGVPLVEALEVTASVVSPPCRPVVNAMRDAVSSGASFADACADVGTFDDVTVAVYRAAERTGDLAGACSQLATTMRRRLAVAGKAATLMIYPAIVLVIAVIVSTIMLVGIAPKMLGDVASELGDNAKLNFFSSAVLALGNFLRANGVWVLLGVAVVVTLLVIARKEVAALIANASRRIPLLRDVVLAQESSRFFSVMAAMTRAGIPLADALGVSAGAIGHPKLREQLNRLRQRLIEGGVLRLLIDDVEALPLATRKLLIAAERAGDLETAFDQLAEDMAALAATRSERALAVLEPGLIICLAVVIGSLVMAMFIPLITAASQIE